MKINSIYFFPNFYFLFIYIIPMNNNEKVKPTIQLVFGGCGGMYNYNLGVASIIQKHFTLGSNVIISGASAGCFPAILSTLNMDIDDLFELWDIPFLREINSFKFGALCKWNKVVRKWIEPQLDEDSYQRANSRFYCSLTSVPSFTNHIVSNWKNNQDLVDGILASCFLPIFDIGKLTANFRGRRYIDGSFTNSYPLPLGDKTPSFIIKRNMWRENNLSWLWCWSDEAWARKLFNWGKEDALNHIEEISSIFNPGTIMELL